MLFDIQVYSASDSDYTQPFIETVDALTAQDAITMVQRRNPDCLVHCINSYNKPKEDYNIGNAIGGLILLGILFGIWLLVEYWHIILPIAVIFLIAYLWDKFSRH